jgi:hypothetical protein
MNALPIPYMLLATSTALSVYWLHAHIMDYHITLWLTTSVDYAKRCNL